MGRIGVFVCHCGHNIAGVVDVEQVAELSREHPDVAFATDYKYMCSDPGQQLIRDSIVEHVFTPVAHLDQAAVVADRLPHMAIPIEMRHLIGDDEGDEALGKTSSGAFDEQPVRGRPAAVFVVRCIVRPLFVG